MADMNRIDDVVNELARRMADPEFDRQLRYATAFWHMREEGDLGLDLSRDHDVATYDEAKQDTMAAETAHAVLRRWTHADFHQDGNLDDVDVADWFVVRLASSPEGEPMCASDLLVYSLMMIDASQPPEATA